MDELEGGLGVVVQTTNHAWVNDVRHAEVIQRCGDGLEVGTAFVAKVIQHQRRIGGHLSDRLTLVVEHSKWVDLSTVASFLVEWEIKQELLQLLAVGRAAILVAEAGDLQTETAQADRTVAAVCQGDHLGVEQRIVDTNGFHAHLLQLTVASGLRALIAEERSVVVELHGQVTAVHVVLDEGAHDAGGALGTQRYRTATAVLEGVHLLAHYVSRFTDAAGKQGGVFEHRQLNVLVASDPCLARELVADMDERTRGGRHIIGHAFRCGKFLELLGLILTHEALV